ncbi:MAG: hypothetical protein WCI67_23825 [Chloroflexales bacterium]
MPEIVLGYAPCVSCGIPFFFSPERVPSLRVNAEGQPDPAGTRQPVCRTCWERRQAHRRQNDLPEEHLLPGAYDGISEEWDRDEP